MDLGLRATGSDEKSSGPQVTVAVNTTMVYCWMICRYHHFRNQNLPVEWRVTIKQIG